MFGLFKKKPALQAQPAFAEMPEAARKAAIDGISTQLADIELSIALTVQREAHHEDRLAHWRKYVSEEADQVRSQQQQRIELQEQQASLISVLAGMGVHYDMRSSR